MRALPVLLLILALVLGGGGAHGAVEVACLGDSVTKGALPFDEEDLGGYPRRLQPLLRRGGLEDARVQNFGRGGDTTVEMLGRFAGNIGGFDVFILLGGTNDVSRIRTGEMTFDDTLDNLEFMMDFALASGIRSILGTLIPRHPDALSDATNSITYEVVLRIRELAWEKRYEIVDFWHALPNRDASTFALFYFPGPDPIGHPNSAGFGKMAEVAAGVVLEGDSQSPVEGRFRSPGGVREITRNTDIDIDLFDFGDGVFQPSATIVINGEPIDTQVTGSRRKTTLFATGLGARRCKAVLSIRALDRANPQNELDLFIFTYEVRGQTLISGDGNGDCRVDGRDLARFGPTFGKSKGEPGYDEEFDFILDGEIDGEDFARLASNFGRQN